MTSWRRSGLGIQRWEANSRGGGTPRKAYTMHCRKTRWQKPTVRSAQKARGGEARGTMAFTRVSALPPRTPMMPCICRPWPLANSQGISPSRASPADVTCEGQRTKPPSVYSFPSHHFMTRMVLSLATFVFFSSRALNTERHPWTL